MVLTVGTKIKTNVYISAWDTTHKVYAVLYYGSTGVITRVNDVTYECVMDDYPEHIFLMNKNWIENA